MAENELKIENERYKMALNAASGGVWEYDFAKKRFIYDERIKSFFDEETPDFEMLETLLGTCDIGGISKNIRHPANKGEAILTEIEDKEGNKKYISSYIQFTPENNKIVGVSFDVTQDIELETSLYEAKEKAEEASRQKSEFLANISRKIRAPLGAIANMIKAAKGEDDLAKIKSSLDRINNLASQILNLTNDVLDISKIETGKLSLINHEFDLSKLVFEAVEITKSCALGKNLSFSCEMEKDIPRYFYGDGFRINQVLLNILNYAKNILGESGEINLKIWAEGRREYYFDINFEISAAGGAAGGSSAVFPFGQGLFNKYCIDDLGLFISKHIIEAMGGKVTAKCAQNGGIAVTFNVLLKGLGNCETKSSPDTFGYIMVVEDSIIDRETICGYLSQEKIKYICFENINEAYDTLVRNPQEFSLILMGYYMKNDEESFAKKIREAGFSIPIIAMGWDLGFENPIPFDGFIKKPFTKEELVEKIKNPALPRQKTG